MSESKPIVKQPPRTWFIFHTTIASIVGMAGAVSVVHAQDVLKFSQPHSLASGLLMSLFVAVVFYTLCLCLIEEQAGVHK